MEMFQSSNIYETFAPFYFLLKLYGIIPFQLNSMSRKVEVKISDILRTFLCWIFLITLLSLNIINGARDPVETSAIMQNGWHYLNLFQIASNFYIQIMNFFNRKYYEDFFKTIYEFDQMVIQLI